MKRVQSALAHFSAFFCARGSYRVHVSSDIVTT